MIKAKTNEDNTQIPLFLRMETAVSFLFAERPDSVKTLDKTGFSNRRKFYIQVKGL